MKMLRYLAALALCAPCAALAQAVPSPAMQVQGPPIDINRGNPVKTGCVYNTAAPTATDTKMVECQADVNGRQMVVPGGNVAHDGVDSGNPVKVGGVANSSPPAAVANNDRVNAWMTVNGALNSTLVGSSGAILDVGGTASDAQSNATSLAVRAFDFNWNGASFDRTRGDVAGTSVQSGLKSTWWRYAAASGGIVNTATAVTVKTAPGASVCNVVRTMTIQHDTLGAATEVALRDGAAGTVMWRSTLQTTATDIASGAGSIVFDPPLIGTANTLTEFLTLTAVTGGVRVNFQGYTVPC